MVYRASAMVLLLAMTAPGAAQLADPLAMTTDAGDQAVMAEAASAISSRTPDLARLNMVLAKLPRPTPLRGMVQTVRAGVLANQKDAGPAVAAIEEALRLLPDDPRPKLVAAGIFTFSGSPQRAADLWIEVSRVAPDYARMTDRYMIMALAGRLVDIGDRVRADRLNARLAEIGFSTGVAPDRSHAALARTREAWRDQRTEDAAASVSAIGDPNDLLTIYIDRGYADLWPRIADWAGPDLTGQSRRYLEELRADWQTADSFETAAPMPGSWRACRRTRRSPRSSCRCSTGYAPIPMRSNRRVPSSLPRSSRAPCYYRAVKPKRAGCWRRWPPRCPPTTRATR
ncbi:hypothetical protein P0F65_06980 [Sphingomonas sp. I4]